MSTITIKNKFRKVAIFEVEDLHITDIMSLYNIKYCFHLSDFHIKWTKYFDVDTHIIIRGNKNYIKKHNKKIINYMMESNIYNLIYLR